MHSLSVVASRESRVIFILEQSVSWDCVSFRLKFNKLKYGSENVPLEEQKANSTEPPTFDDGRDEVTSHTARSPDGVRLDESKEDPNLAFGGSSVSFKQGRQLLRQ